MTKETRYEGRNIFIYFHIKENQDSVFQEIIEPCSKILSPVNQHLEAWFLKSENRLPMGTKTETGGLRSLPLEKKSFIYWSKYIKNIYSLMRAKLWNKNILTTAFPRMFPSIQMMQAETALHRANGQIFQVNVSTLYFLLVLQSRISLMHQQQRRK